MVYGIYQSAGGLQANQYGLEVLANNLANANTAGFKHDLALVRERPVESREHAGDPTFRHEVLDEMSGGSLVAPTFTSFEQGKLEITDRPLDVAIEGDGFFVVSESGQQRYTRDGRFTISKSGELVTVAGGHPVLDIEGNPIKVGTKPSGPVHVDGNGFVRTGKDKVGQLGIVTFDDTTLLRKRGENLLEPLGIEPREAQAALRVGAVESSTVDPTTTLVQMMQTTRAYELNARMVGLADSTLGRAVNDIARIA